MSTRKTGIGRQRSVSGISGAAGSKTKRKSIATMLIDDTFSFTTYQRMVDCWKLPPSYRQKILHADFFCNVIRPLADVELEGIHYLHADFSSRLLRHDGEKNADAFRREISLIAALYKTVIKSLPTKTEVNKLLVIIKKVRKNLAALDNSLDMLMQKSTIEVQGKRIVYFKEKPEFFYFKDRVFKQYQQLRREHGAPDNIPLNVRNFFEAVRWVNTAMQNIDLSDAASAADHQKANGREAQNRNIALLALAATYERCLDRRPTSTVATREQRSLCYADSARILLQQICPAIDDQIAEDTFSDLLKTTISRYKKQCTGVQG